LDARVTPALAADGLEAPRRYWAWAAVMLTIALAVLDSTIANVALPTIASEFGSSPSMTIWIVNGYQLAVVVSLLPFAALGEIYGYRRIQSAGVVVFTLASLACAFADTLTLLTAARIVQGFGAAAMMSVNTALLRYTIPSRNFGAAIGINAFVVAAAATLGPTLAGFVLTWASWPWLFAINVPFGIAGAIIGWINLPESDRSARRFDWQSGLLSAATIALAILAIDSVGHGLPLAVVAAEIVALAVLGTVLVRRALGMTDPLVPLDLLRLPVFSMSIATSIASFMAQMMAFVSLPFMLQSTFGLSPHEVGLAMMPWPLALGVAAPIAGRLSDRYSPAILGGIGLVMLSAGLALLAMLPDDPGFADIVWRMVLCGAGFGMFQSPNNRVLIGAAPRRRSGAASGMLGTARVTGQTVGTALVGLLMAQMGMTGATWALALASAVAFLAALVSLARLGAFKAEAAARQVKPEDVPE
jgi:DHA2 family multidrug resistance protein-like MFS transporter